MSKSNEQVHVA